MEEERSSNYDFKEAEKKILEFWKKEGIYKFDVKKAKNKKIYSIDTPPPTVSGKMHIGHAFSYSQQDFIARFRRMFEGMIFYPFGTDDNGLPTERLVEKTKNVKARDMGREKFIDLCMDYLKKELPKFIQDWKNIGVSADYDLYYSTINSYSRKISQWSFLDLYKKGRAHRKDSPAMWCPECQTGVAQIEVKDREIESTFNDIVFKVGEKDLIIATTRPELLAACAAVFYNPLDKRYSHLKGKKARVPLFDFQVPILEDSKADIEKGTGIVMCCTFGDQTDMEWQKKHNLPIREVIAKDGKLTEIAGKYSGMKIKDARKAIIEDLKNSNLLRKQEKIVHSVNVHERCDTEVEFVKSKQWFIRYLDLKEEMLKWGEKLNWYPEFMKTRYDNWVKGLQWDWLVSNQRYFGVGFPVWYCKKCSEIVLADEKDLPVDPLADRPKKKCKCGSKEFIPEKDILNTWFTSSMTPRLACELVDKKIQSRIFPMNLRPQAHDIITFWLFNTVFKSNMHFGINPFSDVIISGFVTLEGEKMSKSRGNVIEPREVLEKYGADCLRYWASSSKLGEDLNYQEKDLITGKRFITKLWNASRFVFMNLGDYRNTKIRKLEKTDKIFLSRLNQVIQRSTNSFLNYEYSRAKIEADNFFWKDFCDNYLELVKNRVYNGSKEEKESAKYTLYNSLLVVIKIMAPITPFITEEVYQKYFKKNEKEKSIHICDWPGYEKENKKEIEIWDKMLEVIEKVRKIKSENKKSMKAEIILTIDKEDRRIIEDCLKDLKSVCCAKEIKEGSFRVEFI